MELRHDWIAHQEIFYPKSKSSASKVMTTASPVYLVIKGTQVIEAFGEGENFSESVGQTLETARTQLSHRNVIVIEQEHLDQVLSDSLTAPSYYSQVESVRTELGLQGVYPHFLMAQLLSAWNEILPSSYGIYLDLGGQERSVFVIVRKGKIECIERPDTTQVCAGTDREKTLLEVVEHLQEEYRIPVQGLSAEWEDWVSWTHGEHPWRRMAQALRASQAKLVPFRWGVTALIGFKGIF